MNDIIINDDGIVVQIISVQKPLNSDSLIRQRDSLLEVLQQTQAKLDALDAKIAIVQDLESQLP